MINIFEKIFPISAQNEFGRHNKLPKTNKKNKSYIARCGVRTHAPRREPELKSGALDRSANLAAAGGGQNNGE